MRHPRDGTGNAISVAIAVALVAIALPTEGAAQADDAPQNLQYFPADLPRDSLIEFMRSFSLSLGVRCQYCHIGGDGISFQGVDFVSDEDPDKRKARFMLRLTETLNAGLLPLMADRDEPGYRVSCKTCHRGRPKPELLTDRLQRALDAAGPDSASAEYRALQESVAERGMFDFGEWEVNLFAERLEREGRLADAIGIYELNLRSFPESVSILLALGALYERTDDVERALERYEAVVELQPGNARAQARIEALRG